METAILPNLRLLNDSPQIGDITVGLHLVMLVAADVNKTEEQAKKV